MMRTPSAPCPQAPWMSCRGGWSMEVQRPPAESAHVAAVVHKHEAEKLRQGTARQLLDLSVKAE